MRVIKLQEAGYLVIAFVYLMETGYRRIFRENNVFQFNHKTQNPKLILSSMTKDGQVNLALKS